VNFKTFHVLHLAGFRDYLYKIIMIFKHFSVSASLLALFRCLHEKLGTLQLWSQNCVVDGAAPKSDQLKIMLLKLSLPFLHLTTIRLLRGGK